MKRINQKGSALSLVLVVIMVISVLTLPMVMTLGQTHHNTLRAYHEERALYMAESGLDVIRNALIKAIRNHNISVSESDLEAFVNAYHSIPLEFYDGNDRLSIVFNGDSVPPELEFTATSGVGEFEATRTLALQVDALVEGTAGEEHVLLNEEGGIFGKPGVADRLDLFSGGYNPFETLTDGLKLTVDNGNFNDSIPSSDYKNQLKPFFNEKLSERPIPSTALYPVQDPNTEDYTLQSGDITVTSDQSQSLRYTGNITIQPDGAMIIDGDVIAQGHIHLNNTHQKLTINGDLITEGALTIGGYIEDLTVRGNIIAKQGIVFPSSVLKMTVDGVLSSQSFIDFQGSLEQVVIGDGIRAGDSLRFRNIPNLTVHNSIHSNTFIDFQGSVGYLKVNGDISALGNIVFFQNIEDLILEGSGTIVGNSVTFAAGIDRVTMAGHISSNQMVKFDGPIQQYFNLAGSIYAEREIEFNAHNRNIFIGGSLYAGNSIFTLSLENFNVGGMMLALNEIIIRGYVYGMEVDGFVASGVETRFNAGVVVDNGMFGGIGSGGAVVYNSGSGSIDINYNPPALDSVPGVDPDIDFGEWIVR